MTQQDRPQRPAHSTKHKIWPRLRPRGLPLPSKLFFLLLLFSCAASLCVAQNRVPFDLPQTSQLQRIQSALIETSKGTIYVELYPGDAPWHVANFKYLADKGFYRNRPFHLYEAGYYIQGGSPNTNPNAGPGYSLPPEFNRHKHTLGTLGMARLPDLINRQRSSNGSQFYILLDDAPRMDGSFTVFGRVVKGMDVVHDLQKNDLIKNLTVYLQPE